MNRRDFLKSSAAGATLSAFPWQVLAQAEGWKSYEVVTRVEILKPRGTSLAWVPVPGVDGPWQKSVGSSWSGNAARATLVSDGKYGVSMVSAQWNDGEATVLRNGLEHPRMRRSPLRHRATYSTPARQAQVTRMRAY